MFIPPKTWEEAFERNTFNSGGNLVAPDNRNYDWFTYGEGEPYDYDLSDDGVVIVTYHDIIFSETGKEPGLCLLYVKMTLTPAPEVGFIDVEIDLFDSYYGGADESYCGGARYRVSCACAE